MRKYESIIIVKPQVNDKELELIKTNIARKINEYGNVTEIKDCGVKKLAYEIRKNKEGHYLVYQYEMDDKKASTGIAEIERFFRILDEVIKFLTIKID